MFIKGGTIVNDDVIFKADILIENGKISAIGENLKHEPTIEVIDANGKYIFPGGIDAHTHAEFPFMGTRTIDDFQTTTGAAIAGGTTTIMDFVADPSLSLLEAYDQWCVKAKKSCCDYAFHVIVPRWSDEISRDMKTLVEEKGINSFKMFMVYPGLQVGDKDLLKIFQHIRSIGAIALIHAENGDAITLNQERLLKLGVTGPECHLHSRPEELEAEATNRAIVLANEVLCPLYVVHVMSKSSAEVVAKKRREGCIVFGETLASAVAVDGNNIFHKCFKHAAAHVMSPPIRTDSSTPGFLMDMLASGNLVTTGSDNCTFSSEQKAAGKNDFTKIPNGVNGVEERMSVIWEKGVVTGKLDLSQFVAVTSANAAKIFNIYPQKGRIAVGSDADIVVWNPNTIRTISAKTHHLRVDFNVFEGMKIHGAPEYVLCRGNVFVKGDEVKLQPGYGRFVPTPAFPRPAYGRLLQKPCHTIQVVRREGSSLDNIPSCCEIHQGFNIQIMGEEGQTCQGVIKSPAKFGAVSVPIEASASLQLP